MDDRARTAVFFESLLDKEDELNELRREAEKAGIPIIRKSTESFLKWLCTTLRPMNILEIGTCIGYSGLRLLSFSPEPARLVTVEINEKSVKKARHNFKIYGCSDSTELICGDAVEVLKQLSGEYDLIFLDAAKGQYLFMLDDCIRLLKAGGVLVSDNILQNGDTIESRYSIRRRDRTIHKRMRDYLYELSHNDMLITDFISEGDGIAISTKQGAYE